MQSTNGKVRQNRQRGEVLELVRQNLLILVSISWVILGLIQIGGGWMMLTDEFFCGLIIGGLFSCLIFLIIHSNNDDIKDCEKDLPRTQHCKIIAVPDNK